LRDHLKEVIPMDPYGFEFRREVIAACDANEGTHDVAVQFKVSES
jgi:hypothetical protein